MLGILRNPQVYSVSSYVIQQTPKLGRFEDS